jgi:hypothetical protein
MNEFFSLHRTCLYSQLYWVYTFHRLGYPKVIKNFLCKISNIKQTQTQPLRKTLRGGGLNRGEDQIYLFTFKHFIS